MAPLTWRNVDAPSVGGALEATRMMSLLLDRGLANAGDGLARFQDQNANRNTNALVMDAMRIQDPNALRESLMNGTLMAGVDPNNIKPAAFDFVNNQQQKLLAAQQANANITGTNLDNRQQATGMASAADQKLAQAEAAPLLAEITSLAASGDPAKRARAEALTIERASLLNRAGYDPSKVITGNMDTSNAGMKLNQNVAQNQDFFDTRYKGRDADSIVDIAVKNSPNAEAAIKTIQNNPDMDPKVKADAIAKVGAFKGNFYIPTDAEIQMDKLRASVNPNAKVDTINPSILYNNENATRNKPVSQDLARSTSFLADMGVTMEVFSGGQDGKGEGGKRVGSERHDHGGSADVFFKMNGRTLSKDNPADRPILAEIIRRGKENGIGGWGHGDGYMRENAWHVGFGKPGVWGKDGKGANADPFLRAAYDAAPLGSVPKNNEVRVASVGNPPLGTAPAGSAGTSTAPSPAAASIAAAAAPVQVNQPGSDYALPPGDNRDIRDTATRTQLDDIYGTNENFLKATMERPNQGESKSAAVKRVSAATGVPELAINAAMDEIIKDNGVDPDIAAAAIENSVENRDVRDSVLDYVPFLNVLGDRKDAYGEAEKGTNYAKRININEVNRLLDSVREKASGNINRGVADENVRFAKENIKPQLDALQTQLKQSESTYQQRIIAARNNPRLQDQVPQWQALYEQEQAVIKANIQRIRDSSAINIRGRQMKSDTK